MRTHARALHELAARFGVSELRLTSAGRLVGHVSDDRDALDVAEFEVAVRGLLGADIALFSDRVLTKANVTPDLVAAAPLCPLTSGPTVMSCSSSSPCSMS